MDMHACLFVDHRCINVFIHVLNFCGLSQPQKYINSEIFPIYVIIIWKIHHSTPWCGAYSGSTTKILTALATWMIRLCQSFFVLVSCHMIEIRKSASQRALSLVQRVVGLQLLAGNVTRNYYMLGITTINWQHWIVAKHHHLLYVFSLQSTWCYVHT